MESVNRYIVYNPSFSDSSALKGTSGTVDTLTPLTPGVWQRETEDMVKLYDTKSSGFTAVESVSAREGNGESVKDAFGGESEKPGFISGEEASRIIEGRPGSLLGTGMVLKADQFPGIHSSKLQTKSNPQPEIEGAPNFRQIKNEPVYGTAQPTVEGIKSVLREVGAGPDSDPPKKALWTNLREEPVIYINGTSYNLRQNENIFRNLEKTGISAEDVERTEQQLKREILDEASRNGGKLMLTDETKDGKIVHRWVEVSEDSVKTVGEVYDDLKKEGFRVDYARIPVTDEKRPEEKDYDELLNRLKNQDPDTAKIFNCHAGRGRTTTGLVVAGLIDRAEVRDGAGDKITKERAVHEDIRETGNFTRGEYRTILSLIKLLKDGPGSKKEVDEIIDKSDSLQNLRTAILDCKNKSGNAEDPQKAEEAKAKGKDYLERYFSIITFDSYLKDQAPGGYQQSYSDWMKEHKEYNKLLENIELAMGFRSPIGGNGGALVA